MDMASIRAVRGSAGWLCSQSWWRRVTCTTRTSCPPWYSAPASPSAFSQPAGTRLQWPFEQPSRQGHEEQSEQGLALLLTHSNELGPYLDRSTRGLGHAADLGFYGNHAFGTVQVYQQVLPHPGLAGGIASGACGLEPQSNPVG